MHRKIEHYVRPLGIFVAILPLAIIITVVILRVLGMGD
jgi:hypothetical protein